MRLVGKENGTDNELAILPSFVVVIIIVVVGYRYRLISNQN